MSTTSGSPVARRAAVVLLAALCAGAGVAGAATATAPAAPRLTHIQVATVAAADLGEVEKRYTKWLGYVVRERGRVDRALAASWGTPRATNRPYLLMSADGWPEVYIRVVRTPAVRGYRPLATWGWNAIELIVDDPQTLYEQVRRSPFEIIGEPTPLQNYPSILAFQARGSASEILYFAGERGDRSRSILPAPNGAVGRPFIMILAGPDIHGLMDFYASRFGLTPGPVRQRPLPLLEQAQGYEAGRGLPIATARLAAHGNLIQFDGYTERATARPRAPGELPPGVAMTSFGVVDLDALRLPFIRPPAARTGLAYGGRRAATVIGPVGELVELIEAPR